jgi:Cell Wall Hydrolase
MAPRWIGLTRSRANVSIRKRNFFDGMLHSMGAASMLFFAAAMNFALYPDAIASVVGIDRTPAGIVASSSTLPVATPAPVAVDPAELHLLAATTWAEARSEGEDGMRAVAHVIVNRVGARFGDSLRNVILSPKQFSAWNLGDPNRALAQNPERYARDGADKASWETAQEVAYEVLAHQSTDPTNGALFYHTRAINPYWSRFGQGRTVIGAHVFYRNVPDQPRARRFAAATQMRSATRRGERVEGVLPPPATVSVPAPPLNPSDIDGNPST